MWRINKIIETAIEVLDLAAVKGITEESFCTEHCPHWKEKCKGDCEELKAFRKIKKRKYRRIKGDKK